MIQYEALLLLLSFHTYIKDTACSAGIFDVLLICSLYGIYCSVLVNPFPVINMWRTPPLPFRLVWFVHCILEADKAKTLK